MSLLTMWKQKEMEKSPFGTEDWNKPNFFILGAQRSGTTSLWEYLRQHPNIFMSPSKEPFFLAKYGASGFGDASYTADTVEEYMELFAEAEDEKIVGEATAIYYACPWVPRRINRWFSDVKLLMVLRNPVERAWSHYRKHARSKYPMFSSSFRKALREVHTYRLAEEDKIWNFGYISLGKYNEKLRNWKSKIDSENSKIVLHEDIKNDAEETIKSIHRFIGVNENTPSNIEKIYNKTNRSNYKFWENKNICEEDRKLLIDVFKEDIIKTENIIGRDLSHWII